MKHKRINLVSSLYERSDISASRFPATSDLLVETQLTESDKGLLEDLETFLKNPSLAPQTRDHLQSALSEIANEALVGNLN